MGKLIKLDILKEILDKIINLFSEYKLNDIEITFAVSELSRINKQFSSLRNKEIETEFLEKTN